MSWSQALILKDGEQVVHSWEGTFIFHLKGVGKKEIEAFKGMIIRHAERVRSLLIFLIPAFPSTEKHCKGGSCHV